MFLSVSTIGLGEIYRAAHRTRDGLQGIEADRISPHLNPGDVTAFKPAQRTKPSLSQTLLAPDLRNPRANSLALLLILRHGYCALLMVILYT